MEIFKYGPLKALIALLSIFALLPLSAVSADGRKQANINLQNEHIAYLETEYYKNYEGKNQQNFASFGLEEAYADELKLNEVAFLGTHNSYQLSSTKEYQMLYNALDVLTFGIVKGEKTSFNMETLTNQLEAGVRSLEIDVEPDKDGSFIVCHDKMLDNSSSCFDFEKALKELRLWSVNNPAHLPVSVIIEPKSTGFSLDNVKQMDSLIKTHLGDSLLTPAEVKGDYDSLRAMRENGGWPTLEDSLGKIFVILHPAANVKKYAEYDSSFSSQAMFPMVRYDGRNASYACILLEDDPADAIRHEGETVDKGMIVRTRADSFPSYSEERYEKTNNCRSQIISTDYPPTVGENKGHVYSFEGYTVKMVK